MNSAHVHCSQEKSQQSQFEKKKKAKHGCGKRKTCFQKRQPFKRFLVLLCQCLSFGGVSSSHSHIILLWILLMCALRAHDN